MHLKKYGYIILTLFLFSCNSDHKSDKLFWISNKDGDFSDFWFMTESTNILPISVDSISYFLTDKEIESTQILKDKSYHTDSVFNAPVLFKNYGKLYQSDSFKLFVLLRRDNISKGRDDKFLLRTYSLDWDIIDTYEMAIWIDSLNKYCFGSVNKELIIEKKCDDTEGKEIMQITNNGKIEQISSYKP